MKVVHKYELNQAGETILSLPPGFQVLHVDEQHGNLIIWLAVLTALPKYRTRFYTVLTGGPVPDDMTHAGTAVMDGGNFVAHVYYSRG